MPDIAEQLHALQAAYSDDRSSNLVGRLDVPLLFTGYQFEYVTRDGAGNPAFVQHEVVRPLEGVAYEDVGDGVLLPAREAFSPVGAGLLVNLGPLPPYEHEYDKHDPRIVRSTRFYSPPDERTTYGIAGRFAAFPEQEGPQPDPNDRDAFVRVPFSSTYLPSEIGSLYLYRRGVRHDLNAQQIRLIRSMTDPFEAETNLSFASLKLARPVGSVLDSIVAGLFHEDAERSRPQSPVN